MTAVSLSVQPKIFSDRETAISCLVEELVTHFLGSITGDFCTYSRLTDEEAPDETSDI